MESPVCLDGGVGHQHPPTRKLDVAPFQPEQFSGSKSPIAGQVDGRSEPKVDRTSQSSYLDLSNDAQQTLRGLGSLHVSAWVRRDVARLDRPVENLAEDLTSLGDIETNRRIAAAVSSPRVRAGGRLVMLRLGHRGIWLIRSDRCGLLGALRGRGSRISEACLTSRQLTLVASA